MVRCYITGSKASGFGYQEINALYELNNASTNTYFPPRHPREVDNLLNCESMP